MEELFVLILFFLFFIMVIPIILQIEWLTAVLVTKKNTLIYFMTNALLCAIIFTIHLGLKA